MHFIRAPPPPPSVQVQSALLLNAVCLIPRVDLIHAAQDILKNKIFQKKYVPNYLVKRMNAAMQTLLVEVGRVRRETQGNYYPMNIRVKHLNAQMMNAVGKIRNVTHIPAHPLFIL